MQATFIRSPRLTLATTLCALLTVFASMSVVPALGGSDAPTIVHHMPAGNCPPVC